MKRLKFRKSGILIIFISIWGIAKTQAIDFINYTTKDGLTSSTIYGVFQDKKGYLWFATDKGVSRFNGATFINYTKEDGLSDDEVFRIHQDSKNRIWFLTSNGKLSYFSNEKLYNSSNDSLIGKIESTNNVMDFLEDNEHNIWITHKNNTVYKVTPSNQITTFNIVAPYGVWETKEHKVLITSRFKVVNITKDNIVQDFVSGIPESQLKRNYYDSSKNNHYIAFRDTLRVINLSTKQIIQHIPFSSSILFIGKACNPFIWVGTDDGAYLINEKGKIVKQYLPGINITGVFTDHENNTWLATRKNGVYMCTDINTSSYNIGNVNTLLINNNIVFAGGDDLRLTEIKSNSLNTFKLHEQKSKTRGKITIITPFNQSIIVGSDKGIGILNNATRLFNKNMGTIKCLYYCKKDSTIYISANYHTCKIKISSASDIMRYTNNDFRKNLIYQHTTWCFHEDKDHHIIGGTDIGPIIITASDKIELRKKYPSLNTRIYDIESTRKGVYWFACGSQGAKVLIKDKLIDINETKGLFISAIALSSDNDQIWLASNKGIIKINETDGQYKLVRYTSIHGVYENEVNDIIFNNDTLWIATRYGVTPFPINAPNNTYKPFLHLKSFMANKQQIISHDLSKLSFNQNDISIELDGISFKHKGELTYNYELKGAYNYTGSSNKSSLTFEDLPPGKYMLSIIATDNLANTSLPLDMTFTILQPWWQNRWVKLGFAIAVITLLYFLFKIYIFMRNREAIKELIFIIINFFKKEKFILVRSLKDGSNQKIMIHEILWVEAFREYVEIHTQKSKILVRLSMKEMERKLRKIPFISRIHKSYIVNLEAATSIKWNNVSIADTKIPIGRTYSSIVNAYIRSIKARSK